MRDKEVKDIIIEVLTSILNQKDWELKYPDDLYIKDYSKPKKLTLEEKIELYIKNNL